MRFTMIYPTEATTMATTGSTLTTTAGSEGTTQVTSTSVSPSVSTTPGTTQGKKPCLNSMQFSSQLINPQYLSYSFKCLVLYHPLSLDCKRVDSIRKSHVF